MPTYAYACTACEHRFEAQQSFKDASLTECPECSGTLRKLFNSVGIVFKGSGFYRTDSRKDSRSGGGEGSSAPSGDKAAAKSPDGAGSGSTGSGGTDAGSSGGGSSAASSSGSGSSSGSSGSSSSSGSSTSTAGSGGKASTTSAA